MPTPTTLGARVAHRRAALGLTQRVLAAKVGCEQATISRIENGHTEERIEAWILQALGEHLGVTVDELLNGKPKSTRSA